jgi:hypothetical protein
MNYSNYSEVDLWIDKLIYDIEWIQGQEHHPDVARRDIAKLIKDFTDQACDEILDGIRNGQLSAKCLLGEYRYEIDEAIEGIYTQAYENAEIDAREEIGDREYQRGLDNQASHWRNRIALMQDRHIDELEEAAKRHDEIGYKRGSQEAIEKGIAEGTLARYTNEPVTKSKRRLTV